MIEDEEQFNIMLNYIYTKSTKIDIQATVLYMYLEKNGFIIDVSPRDFFKDYDREIMSVLVKNSQNLSNEDVVENQDIMNFFNQSKNVKCLSFSKPYHHCLNTLNKIRVVKNSIIYGSKKTEENMLEKLVKDISLLDKKVKNGYLDKSDKKNIDYIYTKCNMNDYSKFEKL